MRNATKIKKCIGEITEISLLIAAFGVAVEILFGDAVPLFGGIMANLMGLLRTVGENKFIGVVALGIVLYLFRRGKVFA